MSDDLLGGAPGPSPALVSLRDMVACVGREVRLRESAYPKWVASGRLKQAEADLEIARMRAVLNLVAGLAAPSAELLEAVAKAVDQEESAQRGEPSPWRPDLCRGSAGQVFKAERRAAARCGLEALAEAVR